MFDKSHVSIYFQKEKIFVIQLVGNKKKVKKVLSLAIPEGVIVETAIADPKVLSEILRSIWKKNNLSEKSVSLIIPEYTTFTKLFTIPSLKLTELDEAVRYQASEFLPTSLSNLILDWKIVEKETKDVKILLAALDKKILSGYVEAAEMAGLFPLHVETPSLSLSRYLGKINKNGYLLVYSDGVNVLSLVSQGEAMYGTSLTENTSREETVKVAERITHHYKNANVQKVYFAGLGIDEKLITGIKEALGKEVEWLNPKIPLLNARQAQEFIIPITSQFSEIEEPSDPSSLNLLPLRMVEKYKTEKTKLQVWGLTLTITLFVCVSLLLTLGSYFYLDRQVKDIKSANEAKTSVASQREKSLGEAKYVNETVDKILKIKALSVSPVTILNDIRNSLPPGVVIDRYKFTFEVGRIEMEGRSVDRSALIDFKTNLEKNPNVASVEIPLSGFEKETDLVFKLFYDYAPIAKLTKKSKSL